MNTKTPVYIAVMALVISVAAVAIALTNAGPAGPQGEQGVAGPKGQAAPVADVTEVSTSLAKLKACLPEFTTWVQSFRVSTSSNTNGNSYWLTGAYLDTSGQQVSLGCKKILGIAPRGVD